MPVPKNHVLRVGQKVTHDDFPNFGVGEITSFDHEHSLVMVWWRQERLVGSIGYDRNKLTLSIKPKEASMPSRETFNIGDAVTHKNCAEYGEGVIRAFDQDGSIRVYWPDYSPSTMAHNAQYITHALADWEKELLGVPEKQKTIDYLQSQVKLAVAKANAENEILVKQQAAVDAAWEKADQLRAAIRIIEAN